MRSRVLQGDPRRGRGLVVLVLASGLLVSSASVSRPAQPVPAESEAAVDSGPQGPGRDAYLKGMSLMVAGLAPAAVKSFERAIALEPTEARYHNNLTAVLLQSVDTLEEAEQAALRGLEHVPGHAPLWINLGIARHRLGRPAEAVEALEVGLQAAPESGEGHAWLARAYWRLALTDEVVDPELLTRATTSMRAASTIQSESPVVHFQLGLLLELSGDDEAALAAYRQASALAPQHPQGQAKVTELEARLAASAPPASQASARD